MLRLKNAKQREDPFGKVLKEQFPQGLEISKTYDAFDRVLSLKIANQGEVIYNYDPLFLKKI